LAAGWLDAIGGGGGLIQLPAILLVFPPGATAAALGTSKLSAIVGTTAAATNYARTIAPPRKTLKPMMAAAFVGSAIGALLATGLDTSVLRPVIVLLLAGVWVLTWKNPTSRLREVADHESPQHSLILPIIVGGGIGFYDGLIGPGTGIFLLAALVQLFGFSFLRASATAKFVNVATNLAAIITFAMGGHIVVAVGLLMGCANLIGGIVGSKMAIARGSEFVRKVVLVVVAALILKLGWGILS
jgi:uncharacterized membrane protein YfcA